MIYSYQYHALLFRLDADYFRLHTYRAHSALPYRDTARLLPSRDRPPRAEPPYHGAPIFSHFARYRQQLSYLNTIIIGAREEPRRRSVAFGAI